MEISYYILRLAHVVRPPDSETVTDNDESM